MAWSVTSLSAAEVAAWNADVPAFIGGHAARDVIDASASGCIWSKTQDAGATDETNSSYPHWKGYDGFADHERYTKPDTAAWTDWYYIISAPDVLPDFDSVFLYFNDHTGIDAGRISNIAVDIADDATFATRNLELFEESFPTIQHHGGLVAKLDIDGIYSDVKYLSVNLVATTGISPGISEMWLGRRWQLLRPPSLPLSDLSQEYSGSNDPTICGVNTRVDRGRGRSVRDYSIDILSEDELQAYEEFASGCGYGARSIILADKPKSIDDIFVSTVRGSSLDPVRIGPNRWRLDIGLDESQPYWSQV